MGGRTICKLCYNNHDLACCISKLSIKSDVVLQTDFSDKRDRATKQRNHYNNIDPNFLIEYFRKNYCGCCNDNESIVEAKAILGELPRFRAKTREQYNIFLDNCFDK